MHKPALVALLAAGVTACGNNIVLQDTSLPTAQTLMIVAHFDDDEIFMQPDLVNAIEAGSLTTVYITTGDTVDGVGHAMAMFRDARLAYGEIADADDWQCAYTLVTDLPVYHCRLPERGISLVALDVPDGGLYGEFTDSSLHLIEGKLDAVPLLGEIGGYTVTPNQIVEELMAIITATAPAHIHTLDIGQHGYDNSSHLFSAGFALWAIARLGFTGELTSHRGYNVETLPQTLVGPDYARAEYMLGFFDACYLKCGPCGQSCAYPDPAHDNWMERQYSTTRMGPRTGQLAIALADNARACAVASGGGIVLGDCTATTMFTYDTTGHLRVAGGCLAAGDDGTVAIAACSDDPAQYWVLDGEGNLWSGQPVAGDSVSTYNHTRCLTTGGGSSQLSAPVCGDEIHTSWSLVAP